MTGDVDWFMSWWWVTVFGPIVLVCVFAYALLTRRRLTRQEKREQKEAIDELYEGDDDPGTTRKR